MDKEFWKDTGYRVAWTFAEAMLGCMTIGQAITEINWLHALSISAVAGIATFLKQVVKYARQHTKREEDEIFFSERQTTVNEDGDDMYEVTKDEDQNGMSEE